MLTPTQVHLINVATHLPGLYWLFYLSLSDYKNWMLILSVGASCAMHVSETKHGLQGMGRFAPYASMALNLDRACAVLLTLTCLVQHSFWQHYLWYSIVFLLLSAALFVGESTLDLTIYALSHSVWHLGVFSLAGQILYHAAGQRSILFRPM